MGLLRICELYPMNFSKKTVFFRQNKGISFSTLHLKKFQCRTSKFLVHGEKTIAQKIRENLVDDKKKVLV